MTLHDETAYDLHTVHTAILQEREKTMSINHTAIISINYTTPLLPFCASVTWTGTRYPFLPSSPRIIPHVFMAWVLIKPEYETPSIWSMIIKLRYVYYRKLGIMKPVVNGAYT